MEMMHALTHARLVAPRPRNHLLLMSGIHR